MITNASGQGLFRTLTGKFKGMRKEQEFSIYDMKDKTNIVIQSDTRIGTMNLETGILRLSKAFSGGAYFPHLSGTPLSEIKLDENSLAKVKELRAKMYND